jgi:hypothetical protein
MNSVKFGIRTAVLLLIFSSCKKNEFTPPEVAIETPLVRKDNLFPNGVLQFNGKESAIAYYNKIQNKSNLLSEFSPNGFTSFKSYLNDFNQARNIALPSAASAASAAANLIPQVDTAEFIADGKLNLIEDNNLQNLVNSDLQIIVGDKLYQETNVGTFVVDNNKITAFLTFLEQNKNSLLFDTSYHSIPNEVPLGNNQFQVLEGVIRIEPTNPPPPPPCGPNDPNCGGGGGGTGGGGGVPCGQLPPNFQYELHTVSTGFNSDNCVYFDNRRFVFKTQKINIFGLFRQVDIKGKLQRKKKFLWLTYWGPSFADEIIVGCDNMDLETDYIFPHPQQFSSITIPTFPGVANFSLGNNTLHTMGINVNISAINFTRRVLDNAEITSFINKTYNKIVNNVYNDGLKIIETKLVSAISPTYITQYQDYTKHIMSLDNQNKLKWIIGKAEKPEGYTHENNWTFDWNTGFHYTYTIGGGGAGSIEPKSYTYSLKAGSFCGRARVGCNWYGIRTVIIPD